MRDLEIATALDDNLQLSFRDSVGEELRFIRDEIVKARADAGDRSAVVIDHREAKADGEQEAREVVEVEIVPAACGGERRS